VCAAFAHVRERDAFSQVFGAQKLAGLTRTGPCRAARARAMPTEPRSEKSRRRSGKKPAPVDAKHVVKGINTPLTT